MKAIGHLFPERFRLFLSTVYSEGFLIRKVCENLLVNLNNKKLVTVGIFIHLYANWCWSFVDVLLKVIITARVRSTTGGYVFTGVCLFGGGGYPSLWSQILSRGGGTPASARRSTPSLWSRSFLGERGYPSLCSLVPGPFPGEGMEGVPLS